MSEASTARPSPGSADTTGRHQRSAKNYLIDRQFQLKYTGFLVGISLFLSIGLGVLIWNTSSAVIHQGQETVARGKQVLVQSRRVSQVVAMNIAKEYKEDPELAKTFGEEVAKDEAQLTEEQARLERDTAFLEEQQRNLLIGLVVSLALLVGGIGFAGIVFTHKIAGPIYKMKRLLREVGDGKLVVREKLRKGDELVHFFETFEKMVGDLRKRQEAEIAKVDLILKRLDEGPRSQRGNRELDEDGVTLLKKLRREMQDHIEA